MKKILAVLAIVFFATPAYADDASERKVAEELLEVGGLKESMQQSQDQMVGAITGSIIGPIKEKSQCFDDAAAQGFAGDLKTIIVKYMNYDAEKKFMADVYVAEFTEDELKQILAFNKSPVGQKAIQKMPIIMQKGMTFGQNMFKEHQQEIQDQIKQSLAKYIDDKGECKKKQ